MLRYYLYSTHCLTCLSSLSTLLSSLLLSSTSPPQPLWVLQNRNTPQLQGVPAASHNPQCTWSLHTQRPTNHLVRVWSRRLFGLAPVWGHMTELQTSQLHLDWRWPTQSETRPLCSRKLPANEPRSAMVRFSHSSVLVLCVSSRKRTFSPLFIFLL